MKEQLYDIYHQGLRLRTNCTSEEVEQILCIFPRAFSGPGAYRGHEVRPAGLEDKSQADLPVPPVAGSYGEILNPLKEEEPPSKLEKLVDEAHSAFWEEDCLDDMSARFVYSFAELISYLRRQK